MQPRPIASRLWMSTKAATQATEKKIAEEATAAAKEKKADAKAIRRLIQLARPEAKNISGKDTFVIFMTHTVGYPILNPSRPLLPLAAIALLVISSGITMVQYSHGSVYSNCPYYTHSSRILCSLHRYFNSL